MTDLTLWSKIAPHLFSGALHWSVWWQKQLWHWFSRHTNDKNSSAAQLQEDKDATPARSTWYIQQGGLCVLLRVTRQSLKDDLIVCVIPCGRCSGWEGWNQSWGRSRLLVQIRLSRQWHNPEIKEAVVAGRVCVSVCRSRSSCFGLSIWIPECFAMEERHSHAKGFKAFLSANRASDRFLFFLLNLIVLPASTGIHLFVLKQTNKVVRKYWVYKNRYLGHLGFLFLEKKKS